MKVSRILTIFGIVVIATLLSITGNAHAKVLYVGPWEEYTSIQDAIDNATDGDTIIVRDGVYYENIKVTKRLMIKSENGSDNCIIDGRGKTVVTLKADGVTIEGFTIRNSTRVDSAWSAGIRIRSNSNNIRHNKILNNEIGIELESSNNNIIVHNNICSSVSEGIYILSSNNNRIAFNNISDSIYGIWLRSSSNNTIINNTMYSGGVTIYGNKLQHWNTHTIENNTVNGKPIYYFKNKIGGKIPEDAGEVILANCKGMIIENLRIGNTDAGIEIAFSSHITIRDNNISNIYGYGIRLYSFNNSNITNNNISNNGDGIWLSLSDNNSIVYNNISNNYLNGIEIASSNNNIIMHNNIYSNDCEGIYLWSSSNSIITFNNISSNGGTGIWLYSSNGTVITYNSISNNFCGIYIEYSYHNSIEKNNFISNKYQARFHGSSKNRWIGNYWDDWRIILPRPIFGVMPKLLVEGHGGPPIGIRIPWLNFDWLPAMEPYSIG
ncbi:MAG: hypothetical protein DRN19_03325 [Thermoplasmata archaeon]|nr:MAG: hypothetical protein DRN19_03325 [Thermoplasmata archaeon]